MAKSKAEHTYDLVFYSEATEASGDDPQSTLWLSYGNGLGGFVKPADIVVPGHVFQVATGDFNGDGNIDIIDSALFVKKVGDVSQAGIGISLSDGHGGYKYQNIALSADIGLVNYLLPVDVDRDGDLDIITGSENGIDGAGKIAVYLNDGKGKFANPSLLSNPDGLPLYSVATFDYDKDGDQDIYAVLDDNFVRFENDGKGGFTQTAKANFNGVLPADTIFVDIDGDGTKEIVSTSGFRIDFLTTGLISSGKFIDLEDRDWAAAIAVGDLDKDGDQDLVSVNNIAFDSEAGESREVSSVSIYTNDDKGNFSIKTINLPEGSTPDTIQLVDIGGDGDLDILASDLGHASLLINNGSGKYAVTAVKAPPGGFTGVITAEVNNAIQGTAGSDRLDGTDAADLIIGNAGNDQIYGGKGTDAMTGGAGDDRFIFTKLTDSADGARYDLITDFRHNQDRLDFSALNPATKSGKFVFVGEDKFDRHAGEIHFTMVNERGTANDHTTVEVDFDGDRKADMQIELSGLVHLDKGDFIL